MEHGEAVKSLLAVEPTLSSSVGSDFKFIEVKLLEREINLKTLIYRTRIIS